MKNIILKNSREYLKEISNKAEKIINTTNPIESINASYRDKYETMSFGNINVFHLNKYRLSLFLNSELQQEIAIGGNFISAKLNRDILSNKFVFNEDEKNNLYLHKKLPEYYSVIHFRLFKPRKDVKKELEMKNEAFKNMTKTFGLPNDILIKLTGARENPDFRENFDLKMFQEGESVIEDDYPNKCPIYFNINLINKQTEALQYECYIVENDVLINY